MQNVNLIHKMSSYVYMHNCVYSLYKMLFLIVGKHAIVLHYVKCPVKQQGQDKIFLRDTNVIIYPPPVNY